MAKNKSLVFGDVVKDPSDDSLYVAVSGTTALKTNKQYTLFLKITEEFNYGEISSNWHEESEKWENTDKLKILCNLRKIINTAKKMEEELLKDFSK